AGLGAVGRAARNSTAGQAVRSTAGRAASALTGAVAKTGRALANGARASGAKVAQAARGMGKGVADLAKRVAGRAPKGEVVDIPTTKLVTQAEKDALNEYVKRTNAWLAANGPKAIQSTQGQLSRESSAAARAERLRARRAGTPYTGQAGHVPDSAISGTAQPPAGWLDMPGKSNSVAGGVLGSRIGVLLRGFTIDGGPPL
uniref:hypothetical protein n=1 Tax=Actinacidiphila soli TaxID=2487275 RepID=UPI0013E40A06